jgi:glycosyltransferase involved in cell wall biosynthesis
VRVVIDAREYIGKPVTGRDFGASEGLVWRFARAMKQAGHFVNVVVQEEREWEIEGIFWWTPKAFPRDCEVLIACEQLTGIADFTFDTLFVPLNKIDPILAGNEPRVDKFVCLSDNHAKVLCKLNPTIRPDQVTVIGPGVDVPPVRQKIPNSLIWCNSPDRGLVHVARMWPKLKELVPDVSIDVTYNWERYLKGLWWVADTQAQDAHEIQAWMDANPASVRVHNGLSLGEVVECQQRAEVYAYPCDPLMPGSMVHCLAAMEAAAAGCAVILSGVDGLPEVFGDVAEFVNDPTDHNLWAEHIAGILLSDKKRDYAKVSREWAETYPWSTHAQQWQELVKEAAWKQPVLAS